MPKSIFFTSSRLVVAAVAIFCSHIALFQGIFIPAVEAAAVGAEGFTVPNLSCFTLVNRDDMTAVESDLSGVAYDPETGHLFAVNNGDAKVYELDLSTYSKIQEWDLTNLGTGIEDPEGIVFYFYLRQLPGVKLSMMAPAADIPVTESESKRLERPSVSSALSCPLASLSNLSITLSILSL